MFDMLDKNARRPPGRSSGYYSCRRHLSAALHNAAKQGEGRRESLDAADLIVAEPGVEGLTKRSVADGPASRRTLYQYFQASTPSPNGWCRGRESFAREPRELPDTVQRKRDAATSPRRVARVSIRARRPLRELGTTPTASAA